MRELRKQDEENIRLAAAESEREVKSRLERSELPDRPFTQKLTKKNDRIEAFLTKYEGDVSSFQQRFERLGEATQDRRVAVGLEQSKLVAQWKEKHQTADRMIAELEQKLRAQSLDDLSDRLAELQAEHEGLKMGRK